MTPALFLDRDGVINVEKNYQYAIDDFVFIDGIFEATKFFQDLNYKIVVISNQAGIARGFYSESDFENLTNWMLNNFAEKGIFISGVYHCPHHPDFTGKCDCRKPKPGMIFSAAEDHDIDLKHSVLVGDKISDILAGITAGIPFNVLVESGHEVSFKDKQRANLVIDSIADYRKIVELITYS